MTIFEGYSKYYDLLYGDKKYSAEAAFVLELVRRHRPNASCLLELGCGSGGHALLLAQSEINVCGVDRSPWMVEMARCKLETIPGDIRQRLTFLQGDLRHIRLEKRFDAVIALECSRVCALHFDPLVRFKGYLLQSFEGWVCFHPAMAHFTICGFVHAVMLRSNGARLANSI